MSIEQISLPKGVGPQAGKLLDAITQAGSAMDLNRAGGKAEGFVLGLESAKVRVVRAVLSMAGLPSCCCFNGREDHPSEHGCNSLGIKG
ncbi:hypothetical protein HUS97_34190, partial [Pseudomonas protegens]|nr:hypothetical protein [Pseudomonas protegens]